MSDILKELEALRDRWRTHGTPDQRGCADTIDAIIRRYAPGGEPKVSGEPYDPDKHPPYNAPEVDDFSDDSGGAE